MNTIDVSNQQSELNRLEQELSKAETALNPALLRKLSQQHAQLKEIVSTGHSLDDAIRRISESKEIIDSGIDDDEFIAFAHEEIEEASAQAKLIEKKLTLLLLPKDPADDSNTIIEIRAGTGGEEASLFAAALFRMYSRYCEQKGWKLDTMNTSYTGLGGLKEVIFSIDGEKVYSRMKYEAGVHRVQRVPETETSGRIHTSAASVAVLPEIDDVEVDIKPSDLRIDVYRSTGPGGQSVNTTDSAVRIIHTPTGLVVTCQDEKSQHKNKAKALRVLKARLIDKVRADADAERAEQRRSMVRTGDRSEKIRTYNFPQNRVTDHRVGLTVHALEEILGGSLDRVLDPLIEHDVRDRLKQQTSNEA
jgi:peptide chain release factor 1